MATYKEREHLGWLEEYYSTDGGGFLGTRVVQSVSQGVGSNNVRETTLENDLLIKKSFSKERTLKKGTRVRIIVYPLQGRTVE